jgi:Leucine-rich repeat (LRR) protein
VSVQNLTRCHVANLLLLSIVLTTGNNNVSGPIPEEIRAVSRLETIELFHNSLTGSIPKALGSLLSLKVFDAEENQLAGSAFVALPTTLESYRVSSNQLQGHLPDLSYLTGLKQLWVASNGLTGTIPPSLTTITTLGMYCPCAAGLKTAVYTLTHCSCLCDYQTPFSYTRIAWLGLFPTLVL